MTATCLNCRTTHRNLDRSEDGAPEIEATRCADAGCEIDLCRGGCDHLSFQCDGCGERVCLEHRVLIDKRPYCTVCSYEPEPECSCVRIDVDYYDNRRCERCFYHSDYNIRGRAIERENAAARAIKETA